MRRFWHITAFILMIFLIGCGDNKKSTSTYNLPLSYKGKTQKAVISQENILKLTQAIHYLAKLNINLNTNYSSIKNVTVKDHIDKDSGLGYIEFTYENFKESSSGNIINGTSRLDVLALNKITGVVKIKGEFNLKLTTINNNIFLYASVSSDINTLKDEYSPMITHQYRIYDQKNNEHIEILDMKESFTNNEEKITGKLFVESVGYVEFENTYLEYKLFGAKNSKTYLSYRNSGKISVVSDNIQTNDLYYIGNHVTKYEPPRFKTLDKYDELDYHFNELSIHYELDNKDQKNIIVDIDWFVNNKKIETPIKYELPRKYYQENDQIKAILTAIHGDVNTTKEIIFDNTYYKTQFSTDYTDELNIKYYSNDLDFQLNILDNSYFKNIDLNNTTFSWKIEKDSYTTLETVDDTQYQIIPTVKANTFLKSNTIYLKMYNNHKVKILKINLDLKTNYFTYGTYTHFDDDIHIAHVPKLTDMNNDGLKDIVYNYLQDSDYSEKLMVRFQDINGDFYNYKVYDLIDFNQYKRVVDNNIIDLNSDGLKDVVLEVSNDGTYIFLQNQNREFELSKKILSDENGYTRNIKFEDLNQDGLTDMIVEISDKDSVYSDKRQLQFIYQQQNSSWKKEYDIQLEESITSIYYNLTDLNSDGLKDILFTTYSYFSTNSSIKVFYQDTNRKWSKSQILASNILNENNLYSSYLYDINLDGADEVFINNDIYSYTGSLLEKTGTLPIEFKFDWGFAQKGNFNGDGLSDIVLKIDKNKLALLLSSKENYFTIQEYEYKDVDDISRIFVNDLNYDGLDDLIYLYDYDQKISLSLNKKNKFQTSQEYTDIASGHNITRKILFGNFDGKGFKDIYIENNYITFLNANSSKTKPIYLPYGVNLNTQIVDFNNDGIDDIIKMSTDGKMHIALSKKL